MKNQWFEVTQLSQQLYAISEFKHWEKVVSYLVVGSTKAVLFDTGMGYASIIEAVSKITNLPVMVLLTHAHWDHIGSAPLFKDVWVFDDKWEIDQLKRGFETFEIDELKSKAMFSEGFTPRNYVVSGVQSPKLFKKKKTWQVNGWQIEAIHTPGHTPGSVCYVIPKLKVLIGGDTLYPGPIYLQLDESSFEDYFQSVTMLKKMSVGWEKFKILPGHNAVVSDIDLIMKIYRCCKRVVNGKNNFSIGNVSLLTKKGVYGVD